MHITNMRTNLLIILSYASQGSWVRYPVWQHTFVSPSAFSRRAVVSYWRKYVHKVLVNRLGGLSLPRKSVVRLTDRPDMTLDVYRGRKTTMQQQQQLSYACPFYLQSFVVCHLFFCNYLTLLHSERPKLYAILAFLSAIGLRESV